MDAPRLRLQNETKQLEADLIESHRAYLVALKERPDEAENLAAVGALSAVCNFLSAVGIEERYWAPLLDLWGSVGPARTEETLNLARAAYAVTVLQNAGVKSPLKRVAQESGLSITRLENFRKNVIAPNPRAPQIAIDLYQRLLLEGSRSGLPLSAQAELILRVVSEKNDKRV